MTNQRSGGRRPAGESTTATRALETLLKQVVVVEHGRAIELLRELPALGIIVRAVPPTVLAKLNSGLAIVPLGAEDETLSQALTSLRKRQSAVAVLALGNLDSAGETALLREGVDVVLAADASVERIAAQLTALARVLLMPPPSEEAEVIAIRDLTIDLGRREVRAGNRLLALTPTEFRILSHLARRPGRVVSHGEIFSEVHGYAVTDNEAKDILKVHIWRLRSKLAEATPGPTPIINVRGFGYLLERRTERERRAAEAAAEAEADE
jgi:DNA-binding response OmpR family regulator